jgi:hypothetical protein
VPQTEKMMFCTPWPGIRGKWLRIRAAVTVCFWIVVPHRLAPVARIRVSEALCGRCRRVQPFEWPEPTRQQLLRRRARQISELVQTGGLEVVRDDLED